DTYCALPDPPAIAPAATASAVPSTAGESPLYTAARKKLDAYFAPRVNTTFEVYRFRQAKQVEGESLDSFHAKLRQLARHCAFADPDTEIKNQILLSTTSSRLRRYAMQHDLDLEGILKQGRLFEEVEHNVTLMEQGSQQQPNENTVAAIAASAKPSSHHHPPSAIRKPHHSLVIIHVVNTRTHHATTVDYRGRTTVVDPAAQPEASPAGHARRLATSPKYVDRLQSPSVLYARTLPRTATSTLSPLQ
ncbi:unnamed protein product, partial [Ixodes persulcatus]